MPAPRRRARPRWSSRRRPAPHGRRAAAKSGRGSTANAPFTLPSRSLRSSAVCAAVCRTRSSRSGLGLRRRQAARQQQRLVEAALGQPLGRQRHRQHQIGVVQRGLDPGRAAHQHGEAACPAGLAVELVLRDQRRPGIVVGNRGVAGVHRRRLAQAAAAFGWPPPAAAARSAGSAVAAGRSGPRRPRTPAGPARHGTRRTGRARRRQALRSSREASAQYTRSASWPTNVRPPSTPLPRGTGSAPRPRARPGCTRKWHAAWRTGCSGSAWSPRPGPTGSRCAAGWRPMRWSSGAIPRAECFVAREPARIRPQAALDAIGAAVVAAPGPRPPLHHGPFPTAPRRCCGPTWPCTCRPSPQALIAQWHRALAVDGFLMFSCLGPDTLRELRALYRALGWPPPAHDFTDMHDWGDMLVARRLCRAGDGHGAHHADLGNAAAPAGRVARTGRQSPSGPFCRPCGAGWRARLEQELARTLAAARRPPGPDVRDHLRPCREAASDSCE